MLDYGDAPKAARGAGRARPPKDPSQPSLLADALRAGMTRKKLVLALALAGALVGLGVTKSLTPRYLSTAQIYIDPRNLPGFEKDASTIQDSTGFINFVETQAHIMTSQVVLERAVTAERLAADPEFGGGQSFLSKLLGRKPTPESEADMKAAATRALGGKVAIHRAERTFIIDITVTSNDADKSARIANAVAQAYLETRASMQMENARQATTSFTARLGSLRERLLAAEGALEDYKAKNGFIGPRDQYIDDQTLREQNQQLTYAKTRLDETEARYRQAQRAKRSTEELSTLAATMNLASLTALRAANAEVNQKLADLSSELGPQHPAIRNAKARVAETRRQLDAEIERIAQSFKKDYERAREFVGSLQRAVGESRSHAVDSAQASVKLRELEREVEVSRSIYESFLARSRQTAEQQQLDPASTHIVTVAAPPVARSFPPGVMTMSGSGAVAGGLVGVVLAFLLERRKTGATSARNVAKVASGEDFVVTEATRLVRRDAARRRGADLELTRLGVPVAGPFGDRRELQAITERLTLSLKEDDRPMVVAIVGGARDHARTIVAVNIALALVWEGLSIALLDADRNAVLTGFIEDESVASHREQKPFIFTSEQVLLAAPALAPRSATPAAMLRLLRDGEEGRFDIVLCDGAEATLKGVDVALHVIAGDHDDAPTAFDEKIIATVRLDHPDPWGKDAPELKKSA